MDFSYHDSLDTRLSVVEALRRRESTAWEQFVPLFGPLIYAWCRRAGLSRTDAGDLVQEVLLKTWQAIDSFSVRETGSFRGWLRVITRNALLDHFRKQGSRPLAVGGDTFQIELEQLPAVVDQSTQLLGHDLRLLARRALDLLEHSFPEESRLLFELTVMQSLSAREAAAAMGTTPGAVRKAKSRLLRRLRDILGDP